MGRRRQKASTISQTPPPSPSHSFSSSSSSSSSSDFEFTISISPRKYSSVLCPADELFYKGHILPLHLSPRISMVRTLFLASSSTSSSSRDTITTTTTTASRDSTGSASSSDDTNSSFNSDLVLLADCDSSSSSSRPSSVTEDDEFRRLNNGNSSKGFQQIKKTKYFSLTRLFKNDPRSQDNNSSVKRMSATAKDVVRKYLKKVKPLYEKLSQKQQRQQQKMGGGLVINTTCVRSVRDHIEASAKSYSRKENSGGFSHSFSGNLLVRHPRRKSCVSSCPSSKRSSPTHSRIISRGGGRIGNTDTSSMEEVESAIQGAIAHCKNSMNRSLGSNEI